MLETCRQCGGDLKETENGYKCTCCGAKYASLDELYPERKSAVQHLPQGRQNDRHPQPPELQSRRLCIFAVIHDRHRPRLGGIQTGLPQPLNRNKK